MPSTVSSIFASASLKPAGVVRLGTPIPATAQGVYVVALTDDVAADATSGALLPAAPLSRRVLQHLLSIRSEMRLDGAVADVEALADRLSGFRLSDEVVLYIGLAGQPLRTRVRQYYRTELGARNPHAGGWWLKTLSNLDELRVHYAPTPHFDDAEKQMLRAFADAVSPASRAALLDRERVMPFANLRGFDDRIKRHGITGATGELPANASGYEATDDRIESAAPATAGATVAMSELIKPGSAQPVSADADIYAVARTPTPAGRAPLFSRGRVGVKQTQPVTANDIKVGQVRLPWPAKRLLPAERGDVEVAVCGQLMRARWDPKTEGPRSAPVFSGSAPQARRARQTRRGAAAAPRARRSAAAAMSSVWASHAGEPRSSFLHTGVMLHVPASATCSSSAATGKPSRPNSRATPRTRSPGTSLHGRACCGASPSSQRSATPC